MPRFEVFIRSDGRADVVVRLDQGREFRLTGFVSETSARDWVAGRVNSEGGSRSDRGAEASALLPQRP